MTSQNSTKPSVTNSPARQHLQQEAVRTFTWTTCLNCEHWQSTGEVCQRYQTRPPAHVIVHGCPEWCYDIPF